MKTYSVDGTPSNEHEFKTLLRLCAEEAYRKDFDSFIDRDHPRIALPDGWGHIYMSTLLKTVNACKYGYWKDDYAKEKALDFINTLFMFDHFNMTIDGTLFGYQYTEEGK